MQLSLMKSSSLTALSLMGTALLFVLGSYAFGQSHGFIDQDMWASSWEISSYSYGTGGELIYSEVATGGNPNAYGQFDLHLLPGPPPTPRHNSLDMTFIKTDSPVDPSVLGGIESVYCGFDYRYFSWTHGPHPNSVKPVVRQGGTLYKAQPYSQHLDSASWTSTTFSNLTATDFIYYDQNNLPHNPDFSAGGSPVEIGFIAGVSSGHGLEYESVTGIDNFWALAMKNSTPNTWLGIDRLHQAGLTGQGVHIGMAEKDTPWANHASLALQNLPSHSSVQGDADISHATGVASILVGQDAANHFIGAAPAASLTARDTGSGFPWDNLDNQVLALRDAGAEVINLSVTANPDTASNLTVRDLNQTIDRVVDENNVSVVVAIGNVGQQMPDSSTFPDSIGVPANAYNVIAVGSLRGAGDQWTQQAFDSPSGPTTGVYAPGRHKPDIVAPGGYITAARSYDADTGEYTTTSGTSYAAPYVAGTVALMIQAVRKDGQSFTFMSGQEVDPRAIKAALLTAADKNVTTYEGRAWSADSVFSPLDFELGAGGLRSYESVQVLLGTDTETITRNTVLAPIADDTPTAVFSLGSIPENAEVAATLAWNVHLMGAIGDDVLGLTDLDLQLVRDGTVVAGSHSVVDNVEHIYLGSAEAGSYSVRVNWMGSTHPSTLTDDIFALSWRVEVPEPASLAMLIFAAPVLLRRRGT